MKPVWICPRPNYIFGKEWEFLCPVWVTPSRASYSCVHGGLWVEEPPGIYLTLSSVMKVKQECSGFLVPSGLAAIRKEGRKNKSPVLWDCTSLQYLTIAIILAIPVGTNAVFLAFQIHVGLCPSCEERRDLCWLILWLLKDSSETWCPSQSFSSF